MGPKICCIVLPFNPEMGSAPRGYTLARVRADPMVLFLGVHVKSRVSVPDHQLQSTQCGLVQITHMTCFLSPRP